MVENKPLRDAYVKFRLDPLNAKLTDQYFCSTHAISLKTLKELKKDNPDIETTLDNIAVTDEEVNTKTAKMVRAALDKAIKEGASIKSLEGFLNAMVAYMKQRALDAGRPTEIITLKEEELKKLPAEERYRMLISALRRPSN